MNLKIIRLLIVEEVPISFSFDIFIEEMNFPLMLFLYYNISMCILAKYKNLV